MHSCIFQIKRLIDQTESQEKEQEKGHRPERGADQTEIFCFDGGGRTTKADSTACPSKTENPGPNHKCKGNTCY